MLAPARGLGARARGSPPLDLFPTSSLASTSHLTSLSLTSHLSLSLSLSHQPSKPATPAAAGRFSWGWPLPYSYPYTRGPWMTYGRTAGYGPRAGWLGGPYGG